MRNILILFTGGTIASVKTDKGLEPLLDAGQIMSCLPDLKQDMKLDTIQVCNVDSTDMNAAIWLKLVQIIEENYTKYDGFVICHGTDTMAYTAAALSYLIQNSQKPIVLTGAQHPIQQEITDAKRNLRDSIIYAADPDSQDVCLIFDGQVIAGTRAKKTRSFSDQAFSSINYPVLAVLQNQRIIRYILPRRFQDSVRFCHEIDPSVFVLKLTPGIDAAVLKTVFERYDCIIVESFGVGGLPESIIEGFTKLMEEYKHQKIVIITTQVTYEGSSVSTYEVGQRIRGRFDYIEAQDMNFEAVLTKIMWLMAVCDRDMERIRKGFYHSVNYDTMMHEASEN